MNDQPTPAETRAANRPSPVLLVFLIFPLVGMLAAAFMLLANAAPSPTAPPTPAPVALPPEVLPGALHDSPMIDFELPLLDGEESLRLSSFNGRIVFLNFWATWCEPCKRELPAFVEFTRQQPDDGAVILAVNLGETPEQIRAFLQAEGIEGLTVLLDRDSDVSDRYGVFNLPVTFVIDRDGVVRYNKFGEMTRADLDAYVAALDTDVAQ